MNDNSRQLLAGFSILVLDSNGRDWSLRDSIRSILKNLSARTYTFRCHLTPVGIDAPGYSLATRIVGEEQYFLACLNYALSFDVVWLYGNALALNLRAIEPREGSCIVTLALCLVFVEVNNPGQQSVFHQRRIRGRRHLPLWICGSGAK